MISSKLLQPARLVASLGVLFVHTMPSATAQTPARAPDADAQARCERAVREALDPGAAKTVELRFQSAAPRPAAQPGDSASVLQGEGQWRDAAALRSFRFSCNLDARNGESLGVVIRQNPLPAAAVPVPAPPAEPDLSHLSPAACESGAAQALKQRWPRVSQISFDSGTRRLTQHSASRAELQGQGRAQPAPESPALVHFGFDCTLDPRDGRVLALRLNG